jgi:hypothetical protein
MGNIVARVVVMLALLWATVDCIFDGHWVWALIFFVAFIASEHQAFPDR